MNKLSIVCLVAFAACAVRAETMKLDVFGEVNVIDVVDCTKTDHDFVELPAGCSKVEEVLGRQCRVLPMRGDESAMISYRLGKGKGLKANGSYVVVLEYPDDKPRNYVMVNRSTDSHRAFSTGSNFGDAINPAHVDNHPEQIMIPQSGKWERWTCYGSLQDWTCDYGESKVAKDTPKRHLPADGFDFAITQYSRKHDPDSAGVAVAKIILCEIPDETKCYATVNFPKDLPRRHIFWREEMSDGAAIQGGKEKRRCLDQLDWIRHKCRQMKMLGMDVYMKDLLEFGYVQHWDPNGIRMNWAWGADAESNSLWERIINMVTKEYGFQLMPYFEWCGNMGGDYQGKKSYGYRKSAQTLSGEKTYTHITWTENANIDVTDPEALQVTKELLDGTIVRFKDKGQFLGAFFRTRPTQWPISFSDATRKRFGDEMNNGVAPSRKELRGHRKMYDKYIKWWYQKRAAFIDELVKHLRKNGIKDAEVILDGEPSEPGPGLSGGGVVSDDVEYTKKVFADAGIKLDKVVDLKDAVADHRFLKGRAEPCGTWGKWEWQHACPADRPLDFDKKDSAMLAMPVNRMYSVKDPDAFKAYADKNGMVTMVRHHSLNEHNVYYKADGKDTAPIGYDMNDTEKAGRASMMIEVTAMANGDIANIGYLIGSCFARGFPSIAREFNVNFLALPAMPSKIVEGACSDPEVVLREINCGTKGRYYALVHTGKTQKKGVVVKLPGSPTSVEFPAYGKSKKLDDGTITFNAKPFQLLALRVK